MLAARSYMKLKQPSNALGLFREIERTVKPQNDLAFQAAYYRLLCFFQIEGQHLPEQVDAFLQLYRKSRPDDPRIHTALMMKAETLFSQKQTAEAAKAYGQIRVDLVSEKNRPGLLYQRGWCLAEAGDAVGAIHSLSEFIRSYAQDSRVPSALAKRARAYVDTSDSAKAIADFDQLTQPGMPEEFVSYAWLESARLRRAESQLPDMIARYRGLLSNGKKLSANIRAEANYWIGWGLVKTNAAKDAVEPLQIARELRPDAYRKHAGILLALGYYSAQDAAKLAAEVQLAFDGNYAEEIPDQVLQWSGIQSFNARDYPLSEKSLALISSPDDPRATPKEVWRYLAKARLETGNLSGALSAADNVLAVEDDPAWKADGLLDRATALFRLNRFDESRKSAEDSMALRPQGRTSASLRILMGDLEIQANNPKKASAEYLIVVNFHEDRELKPLALSKLIKALEQQNDTTEADNYRKQLETGFPDWKPR
jgi:tetratricopeptide (TPR) repeat protein